MRSANIRLHGCWCSEPCYTLVLNPQARPSACRAPLALALPAPFAERVEELRKQVEERANAASSAQVGWGGPWAADVC